MCLLLVLVYYRLNGCVLLKYMGNTEKILGLGKFLLLFEDAQF